ncbi:hypothetical protein SDRG_00891 [Saprolegnia diclina VS20]|uniref:Peptidase A1 domain-containing protein n=1 Tax=Saprolegnia diclina (strain VS20) TaxID=1156394 RepID=T0S9T7_SAPDV|nr:hypothetical protein SDRG_00891 [Saprolegnia diclina VS20]EQC42048.1 hypothetical protein SDRG_00891 [Saprolegnia diclina VS20]|eukprot:XP_008604617.1 hypothetical protein SDRG_00891 [Saprolegnia diclina VS20]
MLQHAVTVVGLLLATPVLAFHCALVAKTEGYQSQYSVNVSIGTPSQTFDLIIDTGSSDLWVQGTDCTQCYVGPKFNSSQSSTFVPGCARGSCDNTLAYGSGVSTARVGQDRIALNGVPLVDLVQFGVVYSEDASITNVLQNSGILGLGFSAMSFFTHPSPVEYISDFALYLDGTNKSVLSVNQVLDKYAGPHVAWSTIPVEELEGLYTYWTVGLPEATFGSTQLCGSTKNRCQAVLDSGTGFIAIPPQLWIAVLGELQQAGCIMLNRGGPFECMSMASLPTFQLVLGTLQGYKVTIEPSMYAFPVEGASTVLVGLIESPLNLWILGSLFLQYYYTRFDIAKKQVQMISLVEAPKELVPVPIAAADQPSYFDQIYDETYMEHLMVLFIVGASAFMIYTLLFRQPQRSKYEHGYVPDDVLLAKLLSDQPPRRR